MFYLGISIFEKNPDILFPGENLSCLIHDLVRFTEANRASKHPVVEPFPTHCEGYQKGYPTLVKERLQRIRKEKEKLRQDGK
jgi:hypothetical protein